MSSDLHFGPASCPLVLNVEGAGHLPGAGAQRPCVGWQEHGAPGLAGLRPPFSWYLDIRALGQPEAEEGPAFPRGD